MHEIAERIATQIESIYCGLVAIHKLLVEEIEKALNEDYSPVAVLEAIDRTYPLGSMPDLKLVKIVYTELGVDGNEPSI